MSINPGFVGRELPPTEPYLVGREKIREFARAVGAGHPAHHDVTAAREAGHPDLLAPPTFAIVVTLQAQQDLLADPELGLDFTRVVHGDQRFTHHRPVVAGDQLYPRVHVDSVRVAAGNDIISTRTEVTDADGSAVLTAFSTLVSRAPEGAE